MSGVSAGIATQLVLAAVALVAAILAPARVRSLSAGTACAGLGVAAVVTGLLAMAGGAPGPGLRIPVTLPLGLPG